MKNIFRFFSLVAFVACAAISCNKELVEQPLLELDRSNMKMNIGQSQKLNASLKGAEAEFEWNSTDAEIVSVTGDGEVTALAAGTAKIVVSAAGLTKECEVVVVDFTAASMKLNKEFTLDKEPADYSYLMLKDDELQILPRFYNADGERVDELAYPKYDITASNPSKEGTEVLSVNEDGLILALNPGTATIKVSGAGKTAHLTITVKAIELSAYEMSMFVKQSDFLIATVLPETLSTSEKKVVWASSAPEYAKVSSTGAVTALQVTSEPVIISARCGQLVAECCVSVVDFLIDAVVLSELDGLKAADGTYQMFVGDTPYSLGVKFEKDGQDVTEKVKELEVNVAYNSSDPDIAVIENGIISVKNPGTTEISVSCAGQTNKFTLNVIQYVESVQILSPEKNPYIVGKDVTEFTIDYAVYPENASVKTVTFSSTNPNVATVDSKTGLVKVHNVGAATIVLTSDGLMKPHIGADGSKVSEPASVNLVLVASDPDMNSTSLSITGDGVQDGTLDLIKGDAVQLGASVDSDYQGALSWNTTAPNIISVDENGRLTALSIGTGKVLLIAGNDVAELTVNVSGVNPTAIKINEEAGSHPVNVGTILLTASMTAPENGDFAGVNWYSSDENVATVDSEGVVTVKGAGVVTITAKAKSSDGKAELSNVTASVELTFVALGIQEVMITLPKQRIEVGETIQLGCKAVPSDAEIPNQSWSIIDGVGFASITETGLLTGLKAEKEVNQSSFSVWKKVTVLLTVVIDEERQYEAQAQVELIPRQPTGIELDLPQNSQLKINERWDFNPRVLPADLTGLSIECYGTKPNRDYFTPSLRDFVPDLPGEYSLTAYVGTNDNVVYQPQRSFSISAVPYWVQSVSIPATYELEQGGSATLVPEFTSDTPGMEPYDKTLKWTSSNESIVKIDGNGKMTAIAPGTAQITVTTNGAWSVPGGEQSKSASCMVTVNEASVVVNIGDFYYSDGTTSSEIIDGKTVVGIIISRDNAKSTDAKLPENCTHGLVLALGEGEGIWSSSYEAGSVYSWTKANGYTNTTGVYYSNSAWAYVTNDFGKRFLGFNNTSALRGYIAENKYTSGILDVLDDYKSKVTLPDSVSELYIPSIAEMQAVRNNLDVINTALEAAGGVKFVSSTVDHQLDLYWTVSENESSSGQAAALNPFTGELQGGVMKSKSKKVRFIFAF